MPKPLSQNVNMIMPIYRGGDHWKLTLDSLSQARYLFSEVLMSFDGPTRDELAKSLQAGEKAGLADFLLVTPTTMTTTEHMLWLIDQPPISEWNDHQLVMLMAEDDLICVDTLQAGLEATKVNPGSLLFGSWVENGPCIGSDSEALKPNAIHVYPEKQIASRLAEWVRGKEVTTISGMTCELRVLRAHLKQVSGVEGQIRLLSGIRMEYFLATQPTVNALIRCSEPITRIQIHDQQEGRIAARDNRNQDEALYQFWLVISGQQMRLRERFIALLRLGKKIMQRPSVLRVLPNAWSTFRKTNHAT